MGFLRDGERSLRSERQSSRLPGCTNPHRHLPPLPPASEISPHRGRSYGCHMDVAHLKKWHFGPQSPAPFAGGCMQAHTRQAHLCFFPVTTRSSGNHGHGDPSHAVFTIVLLYPTLTSLCAAYWAIACITSQLVGAYFDHVAHVWTTQLNMHCFSLSRLYDNLHK